MNKSSEKPLYFVAFVWLLFFNLKEVENNVQKWRFSFDTFCRFGYNGTILQVAESQKTQNKVFLTARSRVALDYVVCQNVVLIWREVHVLQFLEGGNRFRVCRVNSGIMAKNPKVNLNVF